MSASMPKLEIYCISFSKDEQKKKLSFQSLKDGIVNQCSTPKGAIKMAATASLAGAFAPALLTSGLFAP